MCLRQTKCLCTSAPESRPGVIRAIEGRDCSGLGEVEGEGIITQDKGGLMRNRIEKSTGGFLALVFLVALSSGCSAINSGSDSSSDQTLLFAMNACDIEVDEDKRPVRDASGRVIRQSYLTGRVFDIDVGGLTAFEERVQRLRSSASSANAAAQSDQVWQPLASNLGERLSLEEGFLRIRQDGQTPSYVLPDSQERIDRVNALMAEHSAICDGLGERLSNN
jgi:hypothetical protein